MLLRNSQWKKIELVPGWLDYRNAQLFVTLSSSRLLGAGNFLEVGVFFGKSAVAMGYGRNNDEKIVLIDPFETILIPSNNYDENSQVSLYKDLTLTKMLNFFSFAHKLHPEIHVGSSKDILPQITDQFKFIHLDGAHNYIDVKKDIEYSLKLLSKRSILVFDDYMHSEYPGVTKAINEAIVGDLIIPILNAGKLYCARADTFSEINSLIEKILIEDNFKITRISRSSKKDPFIQIIDFPKIPKQYNYFYRRLLTAFLIRKKILF
jgi:Methyltransferase domain